MKEFEELKAYRLDRGFTAFKGVEMLNFAEVIERVPQRLPQIEVEKLQERGIELLIKGDPSFMNRFQYGDRYIWCDYDYPSKELSLVNLCQVGGTDVG